MVLNPVDVQRLIAAAQNLYLRTLLLTRYGQGLRRAELCDLEVGDIDSQRMMLSAGSLADRSTGGAQSIEVRGNQGNATAGGGNMPCLRSASTRGRTLDR